MSTLVQFYMGNTIILPIKTAARIMELLEGVHVLHSGWNDDNTKIDKNITFTFQNYSEDTFNDIIKAQVLGMTYKEYLNAQRLAAESLQEDKSISTEPE